MLQLKKTDLVSVDGNQGVRVWWIIPPEKKKKVMVLGWTDCAIFKPSLEWPPGLHPGRYEGWGQGSFRIVYLKEMERVAIQPLIKVPDVFHVMGTKPKDTEALLPKHGGTKKAKGVLFTPLVTEGDDPKTFYVSQLSLKRVAKACGTTIKNLYLRLHKVGDEPVVLAFHRGLRAIMGTTETPE